MDFPISPLKALGFDILSVKFENHLPQGAEEIQRVIDSPARNYSLAIDYGIKKQQGFHFIFVKVDVNIDKKSYGHVISVELIGVFEYPEDGEDPAEGDQIVETSGLSMVIAHVRAYIINITSSSTVGRYILPTISLGELLAQKWAEERAVKKNETKSKRAINTKASAQSGKITVGEKIVSKRRTKKS
jgi:preprotein translocase subunit SecB